MVMTKASLPMDSPKASLEAIRVGREDANTTRDHTTSHVLSETGTSRHIRRLQLRNAGFRAAALPSRNVTPQSISSSAHWSSIGGMDASSDAENASPSGMKSASRSGRRRSSGILQELNNATLTRPKKPRPGLASANFSPQNPLESYAPCEDRSLSPPPPRTSIRPRSVKMRAKISQQRRSASGEANRYIEHLEAELAASQSQLASITSPGVTREKSSRMRTLTAEAKHLQEELAAWEDKYERRIQEEVEAHHAVENSLRQRIRTLEDDADEMKARVQELEMQVETTSDSLDAAEAARTTLEKRVEIMSELLAASKVDLYAGTPARPGKHERTKSMLPRFPTAGSLMGSPERLANTRPTSPSAMMALGIFAGDRQSSPQHSLSPTLSAQQSLTCSEFISDTDSVFSDAMTAGGDSMTSAEALDRAAENLNAWGLPVVPHPKSRPARRMRRFGAGIMGPKPLILPSTTQGDYFHPASAPALDRRGTTTAVFPLPPRQSNKLSPIAGRRRSSTTANELTFANLAASSLSICPPEDVAEGNMVCTRAPDSSESRPTTRRYSSCASLTGRDLMEELSAMHAIDSASSHEIECKVTVDMDWPSSEDSMPTRLDDAEQEAPEAHDGLATQEVETMIVAQSPLPGALTLGDCRLNANANDRSTNRLGILSRLRLLFGDLWRSPVALARHLVLTAQSRMRIPGPLRNVQWWLVGVLLGPMAKRRLLSQSATFASSEDSDSLPRNATRSNDTDGGRLAYDTLHQPSSDSALPNSGKCYGLRKRCHYHIHRFKHSPWIWLKFSLTLAFAIGVAFVDGPAVLLQSTLCTCKERLANERDRKTITHC